MKVGGCSILTEVDILENLKNVIMASILSNKISVLQNGEKDDYFVTRKGLR